MPATLTSPASERSAGVATAHRRRTLARWPARAVQAVAIAFALFWSLAPAYWMLSTSFKTELEATRLDPTIWPHEPTFENYTNLVGETLPFVSFFFNTALSCLATAAIAVSVATPAAYALSRARFRLRGGVGYAVLIVRMLPMVVLLTPLYLLLLNARLLDTPFALIVGFSTFGLPFAVWMLKSFIDAVPIEVDGVSKRFGGIKAVDHASLKVEPGEIHALIGPNGAGKTTLFNLVSGAYAPDDGTVRLHGAEIQHLAPDEICQQGLARSFQMTNLFEGLTIYENLRLSAQARHPGRVDFWRDVSSFEEVNAATAELVRFLGLEGIGHVKGRDLSYGGQRLVDLGIALASRPQILLLDEPLAGLAAAERERVSNLIRTVSASLPVLIVEHDIDRVLAFSDQVTVMNQGQVLVSGKPELIRDDSRVQEVYTGKGVHTLAGRTVCTGDKAATVLEVGNINTYYGKSHILNDASLDVRQGEIVALLGRNGAGKSTLLKSLAGLVPPASGSIMFEGKELVGRPAFEIARLGIGYVPQDRGLFAGMTVAENLGLGRLARATDGADGVVWDEERIMAMFPPLKKRLNTAADFLSGGEQQMLAVARALSGNVRLLLLDEPFEGLAPAVVEELFAVFDRLREELPILIVEHNHDLVLTLVDRVFALERGQVFHSGPAVPLLHDLDYRKKILWL